MSEITDLLAAHSVAGKPDLNRVFDRLYAELKQLAAARIAVLGRGDTLDATGLVHEVYLKLVGSDQLALQGRRHFFVCAARAMRQILVDRFRRIDARKRGGEFDRVTLDEREPATDRLGLLTLDAALEDLERIDPALFELVELRYFAGLALPAVAELTGKSLRTAARDWERARALLRVRMTDDAR